MIFRRPKSVTPLIGWNEDIIEQVIRGLELNIVRVLERHAADGGTTGERVGWYRAVWDDRRALLEMLDELRETRKHELRP